MEKTYWHERCETILTSNPKESQAKFAASVLAMIDCNSLLYPTPAQKIVIDRIYGHLERKQLSDTERDALEFMGGVK